MTNNQRVVVVGNVGIDTNVYLPGAEIDWEHEANFTENCDLVGQAGGYASRGFARLGFETALIAHVGADPFGDWIRAELGRDGIDLRGLFIDPAGTSRSVNIMYPDGRRKNFYDGKSHMHLPAPISIGREILSGARLAHFNIPNWARALLPEARSAGAIIACDLQDMIQVDDPYRRDFIAAADILFFSAANAGDPGAFIQALLQARPELIIVAGMGSRGCALGSKAGVAYYAPVELDLPVVDTNGAGDALAAGFLSSYVLEGRDLEDSIRRGQIAARYTCAIKAASHNLIDHAELDDLVRMTAKS